MKKLLSVITIIAMLLAPTSSAFAEEAAAAEDVADAEAVTEETIAEEPAVEEPAGPKEKPAAGKAFYVSQKAQSGGDGSFEKPFSNIDAVKRAVRSSAKTEPITVYVMEGEYYFKDSLTFSKDDSGTEAAPVTWKSYNGEKVTFHGSVQIQGKDIEKVTDTKLLSRVPAAVRDKLYVMKLPSTVANKMGNIFRYGVGTYSHTYKFDTMDVYNNGELMPMSQWPNVGFIDVERLNDTEKSVNVVFSEDITNRFKNWTYAPDIVMGYYTKAGYEHYYSSVSGFDTKERAIKLDPKTVTRNPSLTRMGPSANARAVILNLLEEIDMPGEWVIDREKKLIYIYPQGGKVNGKISVSLTTDPVVTFDGAEYMNLEGITVGYARGHAIQIQNKSKNITIDGCEICNVGDAGVSIDASEKCTVENSDIYNIGSTGVYISNCGNKKFLVEADIVVRNNDIFNIGRFKKAATGAVIPDVSCGITIQNNKMHRIPHQGLWSDESLLVKFDNNEVYEAVRETMDAGAIYVNGLGTDWGIEFTNNFVHDITNTLSGRGTTHGTYADAQHHNVTMDNNIFYNVDSGTAFQNGGSFGSIANNIFVKCPTPILFTDYEKMTHWPTGNRAAGFENVDSEAYLKRFPEMAKWLEFDDPVTRRKTVGVNLYNNICVGYSMTMPPAKSLYEYAKRQDNNIGSIAPSELGFDESKLDYGYDFSYTKDAPIYKKVKDLALIDFAKIGVDRVKELKKVTLLAPENGSENIEGNNAVLAWKGEKGAYRFRVVVSIDENFEAIVYDEIVNETTVTINTLKYGNRKYYWKVYPVISGKAEKVIEMEPDVFTFTTAKSEPLDKTALRNMVNTLGTTYSSFGYDKDIVAQVDEVKADAQVILDSKKAKQSNVRAITKKLQALTTQMYDTTISSVIDVDQFLGDPAQWGGTKAENMELTPEYVTNLTTSAVLAYGGTQINPGEMVRFTLKFNPTGYQSIGICEEPKGRLWNTPGYSAVMRLGFIELQRYNFNADGEIQGGIIEYFPAQKKLVTDMWMMCEFGYSRVHNGTRVILKVDGVTLMDYVDTSTLAVSTPGYFRLENGSSEPMSVGSVNNDTSKSGVTNN